MQEEVELEAHRVALAVAVLVVVLVGLQIEAVEVVEALTQHQAAPVVLVL
jgi:hypothetical protein